MRLAPLRLALGLPLLDARLVGLDGGLQLLRGSGPLGGLGLCRGQVPVATGLGVGS